MFLDCEDLLIHEKCGLPVEVCDCPDSPVFYDWENDVFVDRCPE